MYNTYHYKLITNSYIISSNKCLTTFYKNKKKTNDITNKFKKIFEKKVGIYHDSV